MLIITNRNLKPGARKGENRFGKSFNTAAPDELRIAEARRTGGGWKVDILEDKVRFEGQEMFASEMAFLMMQDRMRRLQKPCIFFIHGFNNDFKDVLERARRLETTYRAEVVAFTWPADGRDATGGRLGGTLAYKNDKRDAIRSVEALDRAFERIASYFTKHSEAARRCNQPVSLLMHSMGNYLFKHLLKSSVYQGETGLFDNVVLCAADVNNEDHERWLDRVSYRRRLYVTINENDSALLASRAKFGENQRARLGHFSQNLVSRKAVYLDFTRARKVGDSHAYFEGDAIQNPAVRRVFTKMLRGERAEDGLRNYNTHSRAYTIP